MSHFTPEKFCSGFHVLNLVWQVEQVQKTKTSITCKSVINWFQVSCRFRSKEAREAEQQRTKEGTLGNPADEIRTDQGIHDDKRSAKIII